MTEALIRNHAAFVWSVADLLRGDYKQSEYGRVILPLAAPGMLTAFMLALVESFAIFPSAILVGQPDNQTHVLTIPIYQAAQDVQHSADGSAYQQWENDAALLAASYTATPHGVTCWYKPTSAGHPQLASVTARIPVVFGPARSGAPVEGTSRAGTGLRVRVSSSQGWTVAQWLMTHASMYGLTKVGYDGWQWSASLTESAWQAAPGTDAGSIVAS